MNPKVMHLFMRTKRVGLDKLRGVRKDKYLTKFTRINSLSNSFNVKKQYCLCRQLKKIRALSANYNNVCIPTFVDLVNKNIEENMAKLRQAKVQYPFICKPLVAHGSDYAHQVNNSSYNKGDTDASASYRFFVVLSAIFLKSWESANVHDAVLYKVFVVGDRYFIVPRPSLKNFKAD
uniref:inositol-1,3,4-trisphosphate 5/6-kinase n=1 Tax=Romanomermis culicivorax TaxID=13658 RepID=A0A915HRJ7_ROMCU